MSDPDTLQNQQENRIKSASLTSLGSIRVLYVEDDPGFRQLTSTLLERKHEHVNVSTHEDAESALDRLGSDEAPTIDCIVSDYQMPGTDGIEFLEAVREMDTELPFILFTGQGSEEIASEAISAGVTEYLQKEGGTDQYTVLVNRIENAVKKYRAEQTIEQTFTALETAREGISLIDEEGRFIYTNKAYAELYGYEPAELRGERWEQLYPDDDVDLVTEEILPQVRKKGGWTGETTHVCADGTEIVTDHALAYTSEGILVSTVRELPPEDSWDERPSLESLDALDDFLYIFDEDGTLQYWNESISEVTGHSDTKLASISPAEFVRPNDREKMNEYIREAQATGESRVEAQLLTESGETIPYEFISRLVTDDDGETVGRIGLGRDISTRKAYERRVAEQNDRLQNFAEVLSHDLRNPLSVALTNLELFAQRGDEEYYDTARTGLDRIDEMISDVLTLARGSGSINYGEYETIGLRESATSAWALVNQDTTTLEIVDSLVVDVDPSRLQQVLENLFRNTIEHCTADTTIRVGVLPDKNGFYVEDDGPGIPPAERDEVFDPGHSTKDGGTGFGLTSVKQISDAHGWDVTVTESDAGGARFEFTGVKTPR